LFHDWDVESFLKYLARLNRPNLSPNIRCMRRGGREADDAAIAEDGPGYSDIVEMAGRDPWGISDKNIAWSHLLQTNLGDKALYGDGQRANERRDALGILRERLAACVSQHAGEVVRLVDKGRERGAAERLGGLVDGGNHSCPQDLERYRIERHGVSARLNGVAHDALKRS
jgi:hypothetical protein